LLENIANNCKVESFQSGDTQYENDIKETHILIKECSYSNITNPKLNRSYPAEIELFGHSYQIKWLDINSSNCKLYFRNGTFSIKEKLEYKIVENSSPYIEFVISQDDTIRIPFWALTQVETHCQQVNRNYLNLPVLPATPFRCPGVHLRRTASPLRAPEGVGASARPLRYSLCCCGKDWWVGKPTLQRISGLSAVNSSLMYNEWKVLPFYRGKEKHPVNHGFMKKILFTRENLSALLLCLILIALVIFTASNSPLWIYQGF
jgi:hypothetical protein